MKKLGFSEFLLHETSTAQQPFILWAKVGHNIKNVHSLTHSLAHTHAYTRTDTHTHTQCSCFSFNTIKLNTKYQNFIYSTFSVSQTAVTMFQ